MTMQNKQPRPHAELIKAWADGAQIQYRKNTEEKWKDSDPPAFVEDYEYRVKPAMTYPACKLSAQEIEEFLEKRRSLPTSYSEDLVRLANYVLACAIDDGQVVTREEFDRAICDRKARDIAIAQAMREQCYTIAQMHSMRTGVLDEMSRIDICAMIRQVKP